MKLRFFALAILAVCSLSTAHCQENDQIARVVYLIGNTATNSMHERQLLALQEQIRKERQPFTIIHLGDIVSKGDLGKQEAELDYLFDLLEARDMGSILFTPGDIDWDNSQEDGLNMVRKMEELVESRVESANIFLPSDGCPGPELIDLSPRLRLIALNTPWWIHPYDVPEAPDSDCRNLTREEVMESLEEAIEESGGRNILIIGHHPLLSSGVYGGHMTLKTHLFPFADASPGNMIPVPLLGSFHAAYRQNVGTLRDMANEDYQDFIDHMRDLMSRNPGLIYASAHEYSLQLLDFEKSFQVISGSISHKEPVGKEPGELFSTSGPGYARLEYSKSGEINITFYESGQESHQELYSRVLYRSGCDTLGRTTVAPNRYYIPCLEEEEGGTGPDTPLSLIHISEPTRPFTLSRMPSSA